MTAISLTWLARLDSGVFTASICRQWANVVDPMSDGRDIGGKRTNLTPAEARLLVATMRHDWPNGVGITAGHEAAGLAYVTAHAAEFPPGVLDGFERFTFRGEGVRWTPPGWRAAYRPVWRIWRSDGEWLDYSSVSWQASAYGDQDRKRLVTIHGQSDGFITPAMRLEEIRRSIRAERVSYGELADLSDLAEHIDPGDVELLEPAGVPESVYRDGTIREWLAAGRPITLEDM